MIGYYHSPGKSGEIYSIQKFTVTSDPSKVDQSMQVKADYKSYPHKHMIIVRVGNNNNEDRRAFIKISSRTNCQYFYDGIDSWTAFDDPNNVKCVLGKAQSGLIPSWAQGIVGIGKKWFGLIADGVILKGTFILRDEQQNKDRNLLTEIKAIPGMITTTISSAKIEGVSWMKRSSCLMKERTSAVFADRYRPMAVNSDIYGMHMLIDAFAKVEGKGDYCWYVTPTSNADPTVWSPLYNNWGGFASSYPAYGSKNFVAEYNDFYTLSFDYYFAGTVGDIKVGAKFYWGFKIDDNPDVNYYADFSLDISTGKWHHCELTVDLRKYKSSVFDKYDKIYFQLRTISGGGYLSPTWRMYHKNIQLQKGQKATEWSPSEEDLKDAVNESKQIAEHAKENAERANQDISIMVDDNILTSTEKKKLMPEWESIKEEKSGIIKSADKYAQTPSDDKNKWLSLTEASNKYADAWQSLYDYIYPIMEDLSSDSAIDGNNFRLCFSNYYQSRQDILNEIAAAAKTFTTEYTYSKEVTDDKFEQTMSKNAGDTLKTSLIKQTAEKISLTVDQIEIGSQNYVANGDFSRVYDAGNLGWDNSLNGSLAAYDWSVGYNNGVPEPEKGYHAHIQHWSGNNEAINEYVLALPNLNAAYGHPGRWIGLMQTLPDLSNVIFKGDEYTVSMDVMCETLGQGIKFGLHLLPNDGREQDFYDKPELPEFILNDEKYKEGFHRINYSFKSTGTYVKYQLYIYGQHGSEGTIYVKNISLRKGNKSSWTPSKRDAEEQIGDTLLPTGIDIKNKEITLKSDKVYFLDNNGNQQVAIKDGKLVANLLDVQGWANANSLTIGGGNAIFNSDGTGSLMNGMVSWRNEESTFTVNGKGSSVIIANKNISDLSGVSSSIYAPIESLNKSAQGRFESDEKILGSFTSLKSDYWTLIPDISVTLSVGNEGDKGSKQVAYAALNVYVNGKIIGTLGSDRADIDKMHVTFKAKSLICYLNENDVVKITCKYTVIAETFGSADVNVKPGNNPLRADVAVNRNVLGLDGISIMYDTSSFFEVKKDNSGNISVLASLPIATTTVEINKLQTNQMYRTADGTVKVKS